MKQTRLLILYSVMVFAGGLLAERLVQNFGGLTRTAQAGPDKSVAANTFLAACNSIAAAMRPSAGSPDVSSDTLSDDGEFVPESTPADFLDARFSAAERPAASDHRKSEVADLIRRDFPTADAHVVDEWATVLADLPTEEVQFILAQKQQLTGSAGGLNPLAGSTFPETLFSEIHETAPQVQDATPQQQPGPQPTRADLIPLQQAIEQTLQNLQGVHVPGYRCRQIVLPIPEIAKGSREGVTSGNSLITGNSAPAGMTVLTRLDIGPLLETGNPLHLCLPTDRECFFCLEPGPVLTRRGDFSVLADRTLGLISGTDAYSLMGPIRIPETAAAVEVTREATVRWKVQDGEWIDAGVIPVIRISNTETLKSGDGVLFRVLRPADAAPAESASFALDSRKVELSNAEVSKEWATLEHFRRLQQEMSRP